MPFYQTQTMMMMIHSMISYVLYYVFFLYLHTARCITDLVWVGQSTSIFYKCIFPYGEPDP